LPGVTDTTIPHAPDHNLYSVIPFEQRERVTELLVDDDWPRDTLLGADGRYRIEVILGKGGFGQAYLAWDARLSRYCVVKRAVVKANWSAAERQVALGNFQREARLLVSLNTPGHPNIPEIYDYLAEHHCLMMKYIEGRTLGQILAEQGRLWERDALRYVRDVCSALVYMHSRKPEPVLHRDIKPSNILIDLAERIWLIDFGLAKAAPLQTGISGISHTQSSGTLGFTPPEQWRGVADPRSDMYALGATLHILLSGHKVSFDASDLSAVLRGDKEPLPPVRRLAPEVRPAIEQLIRQTMSFEPDDRPTAQELLDELDALLRSAVVGIDTSSLGDLVQTAQVVTSLHQLRAPLTDFVGRAEEISALVAALRTTDDRRPTTDDRRPTNDTPRKTHDVTRTTQDARRNTQDIRRNIVGIFGMGGVGKSELALHVAHAVRADYPDAQLFIRLRGATPGTYRSAADGLRDAIRAFEPRATLPEETAELIAFYRGHLQGKRVLILLDDAPDAESVECFLPPEGCALIVTLRVRLAPDIPMTTLDLGLLAREEARTLLLDVSPQLSGDSALDRLLDHCGDLPLAVRVVGATLANNLALTPSRYLARLADEARRLRALKYEQVDVFAALGLGDDLLQADNPHLAWRWRMLGVCPAPFEAAAAASIWEEADRLIAEQALDQLVRRSLLSYDAATGQYRMHDLLRDVARVRRAPEDEYTAHLRHAAHYLAIARESQRRYEAGHDEALAGLVLFDAAWSHIAAAMQWVMATPTREADRLCVYRPEHASILNVRLRPQELIAWCKATADTARRMGNQADEATALMGVGTGYWFAGDFDHAGEYYARSLTHARNAQDRRTESQALAGLGNVAHSSGDFQRAITFYEQYLAIACALDDRRAQSQAMTNLGGCYGELGQFQQAITYYEQSLLLIRDLGDKHTESIVLNNIGNDYLAMGDVDQAIKMLQASLSLIRELGDRFYEAGICWSMGEAFAARGEYSRAAEYMQITVDYERETQHPNVEQDAHTLSEMRLRAEMSLSE
jgi:serine/threonine protein kinase/tetratricopeptide (TPR) repeat protein